MAVRKSDLFDLALQEDDLHVLIIHDSPSDRDYYARCLRDHGFSVDVAATGTDGRKMLKDDSFDCVLLDYYMPREDGIDVLNMPRLNGRQVLEPIRSNMSDLKTPVVIS